MRGLNSVRCQAFSIAADLREAGFDHQAGLLEDQVVRLDDPESRLDALAFIEDLCGVGALGDLDMSEPLRSSWLARLDSLGRSSRRAISRA